MLGFISSRWDLTGTQYNRPDALPGMPPAADGTIEVGLVATMT